MGRGERGGALLEGEALGGIRGGALEDPLLTADRHQLPALGAEPVQVRLARDALILPAMSHGCSPSSLRYANTSEVGRDARIPLLVLERQVWANCVRNPDNG